MEPLKIPWTAYDINSKLDGKIFFFVRFSKYFWQYPAFESVIQTLNFRVIMEPARFNEPENIFIEKK